MERILERSDLLCVGEAKGKEGTMGVSDLPVGVQSGTGCPRCVGLVHVYLNEQRYRMSISQHLAATQSLFVLSFLFF